MNSTLLRHLGSAISSLMLLVSAQVAQADPLDDCRNILMGDTFTLKYENVTPLARMFDNDMAFLSDKGTIIANRQFSPIRGTVVNSGNNRYTETNFDPLDQNQMHYETFFSMKKSYNAFNIPGMRSQLEEMRQKHASNSKFYNCTLIVDNKQFSYVKYGRGSNLYYLDGSKKKGVVSATKPVKSFNGYLYDFGEPVATELLNAMMPNETKMAGTTTYNRISSGTLDSGLYYVDFKATSLKDNVVFDAIRYYFQDGKLIKIKAAKYSSTKDGQIIGNLKIVNITEISNTADDNYFKLPSDLREIG